MESITNLASQKPELLGLVIAAVGALILIGAICKWEWIIGSEASGNRVRTGVFGWIVYKLFGRRVFFMLTGIVGLLGGVVWFVALSMM